MSQIINWLRQSTTDFAYIVLDFGTGFEYLKEEWPTNPNKLDEWLDNYATGTRNLVPLTKEVTIPKLKEVIKKRFEVDSSQHGPYQWKSISSEVDVLTDDDDDGRAIIFHSTNNTPFAPNMENTCANLGSTYLDAYNNFGIEE